MKQNHRGDCNELISRIVDVVAERLLRRELDATERETLTDECCQAVDLNSMDDRSNKYLTPPQLARENGVSPDKVHAWIRSGKLQAINVATNGGMQQQM
jgi:hypothetical protein